MAVYRVNSDGEITRVYLEQFFYSWDFMDFDDNGIVHRRLADVGTFEEIIDRINMSDCSDESDLQNDSSIRNMPRISVIVPVYNTEKYLNESIKSVVNQTYKNLDIIIVDDGSTDGSGNICEKWAKSDSRIDLIHLEKNHKYLVLLN